MLRGTVVKPESYEQGNASCVAEPITVPTRVRWLLHGRVQVPISNPPKDGFLMFDLMIASLGRNW
jgi:hypothetical protein